MALTMQEHEQLVDPSPGDWYNQALVHLERGDRVKALLCFEQILVQQPGDREVQERVHDLRNVIEGPARERYAELRCQIVAAQARLGADAQIAIFNQPALLGIGG